MQGSALYYVPRVLLRIGLLLSLLQRCHNASLPPDHHAAAAPPKLVSGSIGGVVYSSDSDRAEKQIASQTGKANHLPTTTETNQKELTAISRPPAVYTSSEKPGEKELDEPPQLTTATSSAPPVFTSSEKHGFKGLSQSRTQTSSTPVYSSEKHGDEGMDEHAQLTTQTSSPPVQTSSEKSGEIGLNEQPQLTIQTLSQPTAATPTTAQPVVVQPPVNVLLEFINVSAVLISWSYPEQDQSNLVHFLVRYSHDGDPYVNAAAQPTREMSYVFSGMLYGGYYQFQVVAIQGRTTSEPATTDYFINGITAPPGPPTNVRASTLSPSEIDLEWDGPLSPTPLLYLIQWGNISTNLDKVKEVYQSTHVTFGNLEPGQTYYFRLRADISGRMSILTKPVSTTTYKIDLPPVHILVEECIIHTTWIVIEWSKPPVTRFPLPVNSFTVYYGERKMQNPISAAAEEEMGDSTGNNSTVQAQCAGGEGGSDGLPRSDSVPGDEYSINVTQLEPGATYVFCVGYSSGKFRSDWSASQELSTLDGQSV